MKTYKFNIKPIETKSEKETKDLEKGEQSKMSKQDQFEISDGNLLVLKTIPDMMRIPEYRKQLRKLCIDFMTKVSSNNFSGWSRK